METHYSYDPHGNVEWVRQTIEGLGDHYVRYRYDLISGNVLEVLYDENTGGLYYLMSGDPIPGRTDGDQFYQRYFYDADQRLVRVESSRGGNIWDRDAAYSYALHGPLQTVELGEDLLQRMEYTYTIHGWLKGINQFPLNGTIPSDPTPAGYAEDAFAMVLSYYQGDFNRFEDPNQGTATSWTSSLPGSSGATNPWHLSGPDLYNGNISAWTSHMPGLPLPVGNTYTYDVLNRLLTATSHDYSIGKFAPDNGAYDVGPIVYDQNGNILSLSRNGLGTQIDDLAYTYTNGPHGLSNRLGVVEDNVLTPIAVPPAPPPPPVTSEDFKNPTVAIAGDHYEYDGSGNLVRDLADGTRIRWDAYGKVIQVRRTLPQSGGSTPTFEDPSGGPVTELQSEIFFVYDASGNRVAKYVMDYERARALANGALLDEDGDGKPDWEASVTFYVRDANGQVLAVYTRDLHAPEGDYPCWPEYAPTADADGDGIDDLAPPPFPPVYGTAPGQPACDNCSGSMPPPFGIPFNPWQEDSDADGIGDACDQYPTDPTNSPYPEGDRRYIRQPYRAWEDASWGSFPIKLAELHVYGNAAQGRIAMYRPNTPSNTTQIFNPADGDGLVYTRRLEKKQYELKDHLGNVRVVISDLKEVVTAGSQWAADIRSWNNYYPFGMLQPGRHGSAGDYRYGFNGKEMDNEVREDAVTGESGVGNHYDYGARIFDPRIGKFLSVDPLRRRYSAWTPYAYAMNRPIGAVDLDGMQAYDMHEGYVLFQARSEIEKTTFENLIRFVDLMSVKLNEATGVNRAQGKVDLDYLRTQKNSDPIPVTVKFKKMSDPKTIGYSRVTYRLAGEPVQTSATGSDAGDDGRYHGEDQLFTIDDLARDADLRALVQEHQDQVNAVSGTIYLSERLLDPEGYGNPVVQTFNVAETSVHEFRHLVLSLLFGVEEELRIVGEEGGDHYCQRLSEAEALGSDADVETIARHELDGKQNAVPSVYDDYVDQGMIPEEECK